MALLDDADRTLLEAISDLAEQNPFLTGRIACERRALGSDFVDLGSVWHRSEAFRQPNPNVVLLAKRVATAAERLHNRLTKGASGNRRELELYRDLVQYHCYQKHEAALFSLIAAPTASAAGSLYQCFAADLDHFLALPVDGMPSRPATEHLFAVSFQIRRAFHHCFHYILGGSMPAAELRAAVWQSIFTFDMRRYRRSLYRQMGDFTTIITGPSGTGKELVAQAIGRSRYVPFDPVRQCFVADPRSSVFALNLSALSPTLIESELFGHRKGAYTGATSDRIGWLESCGPWGTIFLDEIGELDPAIQVKLLRVLQSRTFHRLGDGRELRFEGKVITATNRDLEAEIEAGRFREDLYFRLCADKIVTPSLHEQVADQPDELRRLVVMLASGIVGDDEAESLADDTLAWIDSGMPTDYAWPGNVRELEQCVRNVLIRREYHPGRSHIRGLEAVSTAAGEDPIPWTKGSWAETLKAGPLTADELLAIYCARVYDETGSYVETARRLGLDRRTVKAKIDQQAQFNS